VGSGTTSGGDGGLDGLGAAGTSFTTATADGYAGGGGGGPGRIRFNTATGSATVSSGGVVSGVVTSGNIGKR